MGSLLPLSNSSRGRKLPFNPILFDLMIENTAAASVDDTIAPRRSPSRRLISRSQDANNPTETAVINIPTVDSARPLRRTGFTLCHLVSRPPEKRMNVRAIIPRSLAISGSLK
jgi:hypothetical protein